MWIICDLVRFVGLHHIDGNKRDGSPRVGVELDKPIGLDAGTVHGIRCGLRSRFAPCPSLSLSLKGPLSFLGPLSLLSVSPYNSSSPSTAKVAA